MPFEGKSDFLLKLQKPNSESNLSFPPRKACCHSETFSWRGEVQKSLLKAQSRTWKTKINFFVMFVLIMVIGLDVIVQFMKLQTTLCNSYLWTLFIKHESPYWPYTIYIGKVISIFCWDRESSTRERAIKRFVFPYFSILLPIRKLLVAPIFATDWVSTYMQSTPAPASMQHKKWRIMKAISWNDFLSKYFSCVLFLFETMAVHALFDCSLSADRNQIVMKFGSFSL